MKGLVGWKISHDPQDCIDSFELGIGQLQNCQQWRRLYSHDIVWIRWSV